MVVSESDVFGRESATYMSSPKRIRNLNSKMTEDQNSLNPCSQQSAHASIGFFPLEGRLDWESGPDRRMTCSVRAWPGWYSN